LWIYAFAVGILAWALMSIPGELGNYIWNGPFWQPATDLTFNVVSALLHLLLPDVVAHRPTMTLGSPDFTVTILSGCTGWEGTALILVFSTSWLWILRREFRFPRALLLVPAAMIAMWLSNAVRITALILIGAAGAPEVAMDGFHSEAGWIAFNFVALVCAVATRQLPWFATRGAPPRRREALTSSPTAACLMPFLAILAAGMTSRAASSGFESLYPLRLAVAAAVLWTFRSHYRQMDWKCGPLSFLFGALVFAGWLALDRFSPVEPAAGVGPPPASWPGLLEFTWLICRFAAAVITVPVAEELAFRAYLIRYLIRRDFDALSPRRFTFFSVLISSLIFGLLHGSHWIAGAMAGLLYAAAYLRRGRIGDATLAHATTNACLGAWVLWSGNWSLW
jgi:exosortase E/protease (VPEID-CTERM system)